MDGKMWAAVCVSTRFAPLHELMLIDKSQRAAKQLLWHNLDTRYSIKCQDHKAVTKTLAKVCHAHLVCLLALVNTSTAQLDVQEHISGLMQGPMGCLRHCEVVPERQQGPGSDLRQGWDVININVLLF
jgi:hypothetical protein